METILDFAEKVLQRATKPMTPQEIIGQGYVPPKGGKTPHKSLISAARKSRAIKRIAPNRYWLKKRMAELREIEIRSIAYDLWEKAGRPVGNGKDFWLKAEKVYEKKS